MASGSNKIRLQHEPIKVMIRFRPPNSKEKKWSKQHKSATNDKITYLPKNEIKISKASGKQKAYHYAFDTILPESTTQKETFATVAEQACDEILQGINSTIFVYGQSGSGKTYSMYGPEERKDEMDISTFGIIPMSAAYIFTILNDASHPLSEDIINYNVRVQFVEIYNEKLRDLLDQTQTPIIREIMIQKKFVPVLQNVTTQKVANLEECISAIRIASSNRTIAATNLNATSSRSHMVMRFIVSIETKNGMKKTGIGNFADLAGSEKVKKTGVKGKQLKEAGNILKSLTTLSQVIDSLEKGRKHIPFKDSKLTFMLKNSLGGNCKTTLLLCASPHIFNRDETIRSIMFGMRCRNVQNVVCVNEVRSKQQLIGENERLKQEVEALKLNLVKGEDVMKEKLNEMDLIQSDLMKQIEENEENLERMKQQIQTLSIEKDESMQREKRLNEELNVLKNELKLSKGDKKMLHEYDEKLKKMNVENVKLFEENEAHRIENERLNAMIDELKNEIIELNESITSLTETAKMESSKSSKEEHSEDAKESRQNQKKIELKSSKLTKEKDEIEKNYKILNAEYADLQGEYFKFSNLIKSEITKYDQNMHEIKSKLNSQKNETAKLMKNLQTFENEQSEQKKMYETNIEELEIMNEEQSNQIKRLNAKFPPKKELTPSLSAETAEHGVIAIEDEEDEKKEEVDAKQNNVPHHSRTRSFGFSRAQTLRHQSPNYSPSTEDDEMLKYTIPANATHRRSRTKKYKKRNLLKTFSVKDVNFVKLKSGNAEDKNDGTSQHQHLLSTRNRALSKTEKIVRRQTVALGTHFEHHLQAQKVKDAKMEKVFDAMEKRKKAKQRKKTLDELNGNNNDKEIDENGRRLSDELFDIGPGYVIDKSQSLRNVLPPQLIPTMNGSNSINFGNVNGIYSQSMLPMGNHYVGLSPNLYPWIQVEDKRKSQSELARKSIEQAKLTQIYDSEYKAMKRRYQQKKRIAAAKKAGANQINYTDEQGATAVYDSDYIIDNEMHQ